MTHAILVYHRIVEGAAERFHDVAVATFERQLDQLLALGARMEAAGGPLRLGDGRGLFITFDDATADHALAGALLERRGLRGVFLVPAGRLGEPGRLTAAQVTELAAAGHIIGAHGLTHGRFDRMEPAELDHELSRSRSILAGLAGREIDWLAPPGGLCPPGLADRAAAHGYRIVRTMRWGLADDDLSGLLPGLPVTSRTTPEAFSRLLAGKGMIRLARIKELVKSVMGEALWDALRERWRR
ncbi:polysaccharide deacetylase family protein [Niveispirillum sp. KHB5.9]|uniref:polysaccharide deacetylase family protein n=1 Tax=Niveispirillum sp. KHB5.9 TaxID=3400269 RepID=UPI003A8ACA87